MRTMAGAQKRHSLVWLQGLGCGAVVALMPAMALLLGVLLLPAFIAVIYDRQTGRPVGRSVLLYSCAATITPVLTLWNAGRSMDACLTLLGDVGVIGTAWSGAAAGWLVAELMPILALVALEAFSRTRAARLHAERDRIVEEWGFGRPVDQ